MKEKMRKVRYPMLIVWGIFMGAAGTAGVKSSWHVIPGWLIGVIVILGIMVMLTWMISGKNDKSIKTPEKETEKLTSKYNSEISVISKAVEEPVELEFWGKRNGIDQFRVKSIAGRNIVSDHVLLISFDGSEARDVALVNIPVRQHRKSGRRETVCPGLRKPLMRVYSRNVLSKP